MFGLTLPEKQRGFGNLLSFSLETKRGLVKMDLKEERGELKGRLKKDGTTRVFGRNLPERAWIDPLLETEGGLVQTSPLKQRVFGLTPRWNQRGLGLNHPSDKRGVWFKQPLPAPAPHRKALPPDRPFPEVSQNDPREAQTHNLGGPWP